MGCGQDVGARAAEIAVERQAVIRRRRARRRHRDRENRVGSEPALGLGAIQFNHLLIEPALIGSIPDSPVHRRSRH